jgi:hypothetical protein
VPWNAGWAKIARTVPKNLPREGSIMPRIHESNAQIPEVTHVAGRESCPSRARDPGDQQISNFDGPTGTALFRGHIRRRFRRPPIDRQDSTIQLALEGFGECAFQSPSAASISENSDPETDFENSDRGCPKRFRRLVIKPSDNGRFGIAAHQRRQDVRVEYDHSGKSAGRAGWPRNSAISSSSSIPVKCALNPEPNGGAVISPMTALRSISRTSSSVLRPCRRARSISRDFSSSSRLRTSICAISALS